MCALRNYVQHKANGIHRLEGGSGTDEDTNGWVEAVRLYAMRATLRADDGFKARVLDKEPEKIDVRRRARRSVEGLGVVHIALRELSAEHVKRARVCIESAISDYKSAGAESALGLTACRRESNEGVVPVLLNWDDVRLRLVAKNARPVQLWPRRTHRHPTPEKIMKMRESANLTQADAASRVFVSPERWRDFEDGLPMPEGLFHLFELQLGCHKTHRLEPFKADGSENEPLLG